MHLIERTCAVCHAKNHMEVFDQPTETIIGIGDIGYHHKIQLCRDCGFVFASPVLTEEMILKFYEQMGNYEHPQSKGLRPQAELNQIHRYVDLIVSRFPEKFQGNALDIGCATAYGLSCFKKQGWDVVGVDPSEKCVALSQELFAVRVIQGFFDMKVLAKEKPFDLIMLCHVVEHLVHPDQVIKSLRELMTEDGIVYIEVPNLMKPFAPKCYFGFEHVNFFTPVSLVNLIQANGFDVDALKLFDNGPEISPFYPVIGITIKKSSKKYSMKNDHEHVLAVINRFKAESESLVSSLQEKVNTILSQTASGKLALWGAGIHTSQLLSETALGTTKLACIFDNDPKKHGSMLMNHLVTQFSGNAIELKKTVDAILISSEASEDIIYDQISYLENQGINIYRLYNRQAGMIAS